MICKNEEEKGATSPPVFAPLELSFCLFVFVFPRLSPPRRTTTRRGKGGPQLRNFISWCCTGLFLSLKLVSIILLRLSER